MDKSVLMLIGTDAPPPPRFLEQLEFKLVDKIKILGLEIHRNPENLYECPSHKINEITKIVRFWDRFFLSLPGTPKNILWGTLNIAKTMILFQISYLLPPVRNKLQQ